MSSLFYQDVLFIIMIWFSVLGSIVLLNSMRQDNEAKELRQRIKDLREQLEFEKKRCDELLRDAAIKNAIMTALYAAWRKGELEECYRRGGRFRVLADGTPICELPERDKSYSIRVDEGDGFGDQ